MLPGFVWRDHIPFAPQYRSMQKTTCQVALLVDAVLGRWQKYCQ
jgi:hypothetical protein